MRQWSIVGGAVTVLAAWACSSSDTPSGGASGGAAGVATGGSAAGTLGNAGKTAAGRGGSGGTSGAAGSTNSSGGRGGTAAAGRAGGGRGGAAGRAGGAGSDAAGAAGEIGTAGASTGGGATAPTSCENPAWDPADFDTVLEVGPGLAFETPSDVPWESLAPGTLVRIHHRAEPYRDKWVVSTTGTAAKPVVVLGVPENGELPVISGENAATRSQLDFWNQNRGIIKVGGSNQPSGPAAYVTIECLDVTTARPGTTFSATNGDSTEYSENAACLYLEDGAHITLRNNTVHGCGNGIFASSGSSEVLVASNYVYDNGIDGSIYEHNSYTEALGITFEFNHYGPLCGTCEGNNLKDRSAGTVIRYNWIESGNRELDLVESDHAELVADPRYHQTFVYGNVLVEPNEPGNSQIVHYGGDGDDTSMFRKGTLYFYSNSVISTRSGNTTLFRCSTEDESVDARNNIVSASAGGDKLALSAGMGAVSLADNWLPTGWVDSHDAVTGSVDAVRSVTGTAPGFVDMSGQDFTLGTNSPCIGKAGQFAPVSAAYPVEFEYLRYQTGKARPTTADLGAYESE